MVHGGDLIWLYLNLQKYHIKINLLMYLIMENIQEILLTLMILWEV